jgi:hypothetical protein
MLFSLVLQRNKRSHWLSSRAACLNWRPSVNRLIVADFGGTAGVLDKISSRSAGRCRRVSSRSFGSGYDGLEERHLQILGQMLEKQYLVGGERAPGLGAALGGPQLRLARQQHL